jgi:hypothetical protein
MARLKILRLLLKEIDDKYVQENFYKLKLYLDNLEDVLKNGLTGPDGDTIVIGGTPPPVVSAPKLTQIFNTDVSTVVSDFVYLNGTNTVTKVTDNLSATIPNGIFGVGFSKPNPTQIEVMFVGVGAGYSGLTPGLPVFVSTSGSPTHTPPTTGMVQQIGFAISASEIFFNLMQAMRRV